MKKDAEYYKKKLNLFTHVEGGSFIETYRSLELLEKGSLKGNFQNNPSCSTAIYFMLEFGQFSAMHRIASDELWHFYDGQALTIYELDQLGYLHKHLLGSNLENGEQFQCLIKAGNWFGSRCEIENGFSLVGCTVSPGFDFADFELAKKNNMIDQFPAYKMLWDEMCQD